MIAVENCFLVPSQDSPCFYQKLSSVGTSVMHSFRHPGMSHGDDVVMVGSARNVSENTPSSLDGPSHLDSSSPATLTIVPA